MLTRCATAVKPLVILAAIVATCAHVCLASYVVSGFRLRVPLRRTAVALAEAVSRTVEAAQSGNDLFQQALSKERAEGQIEEAIQIYERVVTAFASDRPLAAKALLQMGRCYERLGKSEAQKAYTRLLREYADQHAMADEARGRLAELSREAAPAGLAVRRVWWGKDVDLQGTVSLDGRYLSYADTKTGDLAVRDLLTGKATRLTEGDAPIPWREFAQASVIARDSRQVAYAWFNTDEFYELRVTRIDRPAARIVYRNPEVAYLEPFAWSEDAKSIVVGLERKDGGVQIALIAVADGTARALKTFDWQWPDVSLSRDGRFIAYAAAPRDEELQRDIFLLSTDGSREIPLVRHPADDATPVWTPDGSGVVFTSDRSGGFDVWFVGVAAGRAAGSPTLVKRSIGAGFPVGFTREGALYYALFARSLEVYIGAVDPQSGRALAERTLISERFVGTNFAPDWSPDGNRLSYVSQRGAGGPGSSVIVIHSITNSAERELVQRLRYFHRPRWTHDGAGVAVQGRAVRGSNGLFRIDPETGRIDALVHSEGGGFAAYQVWSPDGRTLYYASHMPKEDHIVARDVETGAERDVARAPGGGDMGISPDGQWLAVRFTDPAGKWTSIRLVPTAGGEARDLIVLQPPEAVFNFGGLSWTPDGRQLLFVKARQGSERRELWRVDVASGLAEPTGLAVDGLQYVRLHPDGHRIAYWLGSAKAKSGRSNTSCRRRRARSVPAALERSDDRTTVPPYPRCPPRWRSSVGRGDDGHGGVRL